MHLIGKKDAPAFASTTRLREALGEVARHFSIEALCAGQVGELIRDILEKAGKLAQRESPLQPLFMFWYTLCLPIFRSDSMPALFDRMVQALRGRVRGLPLRAVTDGALVKARKKLGMSPMRRFFRAIARTVHRGPSFFGWRVTAIDGVRLNVPDTPASARVFGRPRSHRGPSAYPQVLATVLHDVLTREFLDAKVSRFDGSEPGSAKRLVRRSVQAGDIVLLDRGLCGLPLFREILEKGAHFLARASSVLKLTPLGGKKARRAGDYRAIMRARVPLAPGESRSSTMGRPGKTKVVELEVRVIEYRVRGFKPVRLVTDVMDQSLRAEEFIKLYHRRWEVEITFDEAKTTQLAPAKGTGHTELRSMTPRGVIQEVYALLASYTLLRRTIAAAAEEHGLQPTEISFSDALRVIKNTIPVMAGASAAELPRLYRQMLVDIAACRLLRVCRPRRYARVVKRKVGKFPLKRRQHRALPPVDPVAAFLLARQKEKAA